MESLKDGLQTDDFTMLLYVHRPREEIIIQISFCKTDHWSSCNAHRKRTVVICARVDIILQRHTIRLL